MRNNKISVDKIKALLSTLSMALLAIQHFVGLLADSISISYIPLLITFLTIFIGAMDTDKIKEIKWVSLFAAILIILTGCILYTIQQYGININDNINNIYTKIMFGLIGILSLVLSILYVKQICELEEY